MSGSGALIQLLTNTLSPDGDVRRAAEESLRVSANATGFPRALAEVVANQNSCQLPLRQLAAVLLKQYIKEYWEVAPGTGKTPCSPEEKKFVRDALPHGLMENQSKMQTAVGVAIASIAMHDWPEKWPELFPGLLQLLRSPASHQVLGAVRCLALLTDHISNTQLPQLLPPLLPELAGLCGVAGGASSTAHPAQVQASALKVYRLVAETAANMKHASKCSHHLESLRH
jgi:hypothetical protein